MAKPVINCGQVTPFYEVDETKTTIK